MGLAFIVSIDRQVLDACQFLHHRGIVHLNLQPDAVIMESRRRFDVKLVDFGRSRNISSYDGQPVPREGMTEFMGTACASVIDAHDAFGVDFRHIFIPVEITIIMCTLKLYEL